MATGHGEDPGAIALGTGRVVRMTGPDTMEPIVTGLALPVAMDFGPDGALYIAGPTFGADEGQGTILRIDLSAGEPVVVLAELPAGPSARRRVPTRWMSFSPMPREWAAVGTTDAVRDLLLPLRCQLHGLPGEVDVGWNFSGYSATQICLRIMRFSGSSRSASRHTAAASSFPRLQRTRPSRSFVSTSSRSRGPVHKELGVDSDPDRPSQKALNEGKSAGFSIEKPPNFAQRTIPSSSTRTPLGTTLKPTRCAQLTMGVNDGREAHPANRRTDARLPARRARSRWRSIRSPTVHDRQKRCHPGSCSRQRHQDPQKYSNTRFPRSACRSSAVPSRVGKVGMERRVPHARHGVRS